MHSLSGTMSIVNLQHIMSTMHSMTEMYMTALLFCSVLIVIQVKPKCKPMGNEPIPHPSFYTPHCLTCWGHRESRSLSLLTWANNSIIFTDTKLFYGHNGFKVFIFMYSDLNIKKTSRAVKATFLV